MVLVNQVQAPVKVEGFHHSLPGGIEEVLSAARGSQVAEITRVLRNFDAPLAGSGCCSGSKDKCEVIAYI